MKNLDLRSVMIGFLGCLCMFLFMGQTSIADKRGIVGKYQGFADGGESDNVYRINTITGGIEVKNHKLQLIGKLNKEGWEKLP